MYAPTTGSHALSLHDALPIYQSWREMHQSRMFRIHSKYVLLQLSGTKTMRPCSTSRMAGSARGWIFTNHCRLRRGSTTDRKSTRLNSSHSQISYAVFCLKKKKKNKKIKRIY